MPGFAQSYLKKHRLYPTFINTLPADNLQGIVVIPCYNEPDVISTLESLRACEFNNLSIEVIIVINSPEGASAYVINQNKNTFEDISRFAEIYNNSYLRFYPISVKNLPKKTAGAGLARKIGMDEAVHRFDINNNKDGIIYSLDADSTVDKNYFIKNAEQYKKHQKTNATIVHFEHRAETGAAKTQQHAIEQYELYLRYYTEALRFTGFPLAFHTIGSCFTVKVDTYCKQGGMNQKQAGEDFYFLQKVFPLGFVFEVNSTTVYPSTRFSDRNPFGTGPSLVKIVEQNSGLKVYNPASFADIKSFFDQIENIYNNRLSIHTIPKTILDYYSEKELLEKINEIWNNCSNFSNFYIRFFRNFNNFFIVKFLNYCSHNIYDDIPIYDAANWILNQKGYYIEPNEMLNILRELQRKNRYSFTPPR